jgi:regulator of sirC expression with transglutaminase-like and TPR domain
MSEIDGGDPGGIDFRREFERMVARPEEDLDLGRAALLVAGEEFPGLDVDAYLARLDRFAEAVNDRTPSGLPPGERALQVGRYLFGELGFRGNSSDYYNPDNSYFNRVLETQTGIPITLSLLFLEVARRIGIRCRGVGMPGHFLVGLEGVEVYFDPFNAGVALTPGDCRNLAERLFGQRLSWNDGYLAPCTKYEFLFRLLNNLKVVYERTEAPEKAAAVIQRMILVNPDARDLHKDLAAMQYQQQQYRASIVSLETYLREAGTAPDASDVKSWIDSIRDTLNRLN